MAGGTDEAMRAAEDWLARFGASLEGADDAGLTRLLQPDSHWRDLLALTGTIATTSGRDTIQPRLTAQARRLRAGGFRLAPRRTPPRRVTRAGTAAIEAIFAFETEQGRGSGVVRLCPDETNGGAPQAWTLLTALDERTGGDRPAPNGEAYSRDFRGPNWLDRRREAAAYHNRDPAVLVVGAGQGGLAIAARLGHLGIDTLVVDREARVGDNWRNRYHALTLHNQVQVNHLPLMPFPPGWPTYIPKDKLANWFESYVDALELNVWTSTAFEGGSYDEAGGRWTVSLRCGDGTSRTMRPRHVVLATGVSGIPNRPEIPTLDRFAGTVMHASQYRDGEDWAGRRVTVIGTGNSGHDIAQDLWSSGAGVTLVQRSPTLVTQIEPSAQLAYTLYDEGPPLADCDLLAAAMPAPVARQAHRLMTERARELDRPLLDGLAQRGFRLDFGEDETGWQFKYLTRGGGYYFNVGCSDLVVSGEIGLLQMSDIAGFEPEGVRLQDGTVCPADLVVLATGYKGQEHLVDKLFGAEVAERVGPIWGFGDGQELRNMYVRTAQPGLWFIAGSLAQCRIYSHYLALQIQEDEAALAA